nr:5707_t:CDS:1 [Entrophospora candida]
MWGQTQSHAQVTLTAYQRKAIYKTLYFMIEELEQCIDKCYSNWHNKKQIRDDNRPLIDSLEEATESFSAALFGFNKALTNRPSHLLPELQNEFYRWFDGTGVNASNYFRNLSNVLFNTYEVLIGQGIVLPKKHLIEVMQTLIE